MALDRLKHLLAHRFLCFSCIFLCFSYSYVQQPKSAVNFWAHNNIVFDLIWFHMLNDCLTMCMHIQTFANCTWCLSPSFGNGRAGDGVMSSVLQQMHAFASSRTSKWWHLMLHFADIHYGSLSCTPLQASETAQLHHTETKSATCIVHHVH